MTVDPYERRLKMEERTGVSKFGPSPRDPAGSGTPLAFSPIDNGLDYLVSVVDHIAPDEYGEKPGPRQLKYVVLHLQAAAEVLLKARLEQEHWSLVAEKITDRRFSRAKFEKGDFTSITPGEALRRIRDIVGFEITVDEEKSLDALTKARNALQHYGLTETYESVEALAAKVLDFLIRFLYEALYSDVQALAAAGDDVLQDLEYISAGVNRMHTYISQRLERIRPSLEGLAALTVQCPRCFHNTLVVERNRASDSRLTSRCRFCHVEWLPFALAYEYAVIHNSGMDTDNLPACSSCGSSRAVAREVIRVCDLPPSPEDDGPWPEAQSLGCVDFCFECAAPVTAPASEA
ncbi:hypothetical protein [Streptomyces sp. FXY-T5]|uniref:hypothetical protein n=1 Tax=Streptomyces sp. FXY-T5 TaxID=3064901 RepID=UPI0027D32F2C|nr:hypothetical protein [Streptomyces sp. FXY-T5]WMD05582.1 hypothetical protein Q7C01_14785 [Streptomyces sp. FXY-T5]